MCRRARACHKRVRASPLAGDALESQCLSTFTAHTVQQSFTVYTVQQCGNKPKKKFNLLFFYKNGHAHDTNCPTSGL